MIKEKRPSEAQKTMGVWKTLTGDSQEETTRRREISRRCASHILRGNNFTWSEARIAYTTMYDSVSGNIAYLLQTSTWSGNSTANS